jgi:hypothetical protein
MKMNTAMQSWDPIKLVKEITPSLVDVATKLMENEPQGGRWFISDAGPRPDAHNFNPDEEPRFILEFRVAHPSFESEYYLPVFIVFKTKVVVEVMVRDDINSIDWFPETSYTMTHDECLAYMRSLPKPFTSFLQS